MVAENDASASLMRRTCAAMSASKPAGSTPAKARKTQAREESSTNPDDIAKVVDRNIGRMFGSTVPAAAIDVVLVDGKTMRDRMVADRLALLQQGKLRADPSYFGAIKKQYMAALTGTTVVEAGAGSGDVPEALATAIAKARARQRRDRKREPIVHYLWQCKAKLNQRSVIELVDLLVETQQHNCLKQAMLVHDVFAAFQRLSMMQDYAMELKPVLPILEDSLITIYRNEAKSQKGYGFDIFWSKYKATASLFLKNDLVQRVLDENEDWCRCTPELSALATSGSLGIEVFLPFCPEVLGSHLNSFMRDRAASLSSKTKVGMAEVNAVVDEMLREADRLKADRLVSARSYEYDFMDQVVSIHTNTAIEQALGHIQRQKVTCTLQAIGETV